MRSVTATRSGRGTTGSDPFAVVAGFTLAGGSVPCANWTSRAVGIGSGGASVGSPGHRDGFTRRDSLEEVHLASGQGAKLADGQTFECDWANRHPGQHHDLVTELGEHPPDLTVLAFGKDHFEDRRITLLGHGSHSLGANFPLGQPDSIGQLIESLAFRSAGDNDPVKLLDPEPRVGQLVGKLAIVGQEHQADAHLVEPTDGVNALRDLGHQVEDAWAARGVVVGRHIALGLIDREVDQAFLMNLLAVHGDRGLGQVDLGAKLADDLTADGDATLENHLLADAAGTDPGMSQNLLQTISTRISLGGPGLARRVGLGSRRLGLSASLGTGTF